jgi:hypothetical protein
MGDDGDVLLPRELAGYVNAFVRFIDVVVQVWGLEIWFVSTHLC